jgi:CO dehydrogenase/acetyl-CoA synthase alpha subunit
MIKDLNVRSETVKIQGNTGNSLDHIGTCSNFMNGTPKAQQLRESIEKWDYMILKSFCIVKETVTRLKRQLTEGEKIFTRYTSDKGLITRIYRELKNT